MAPVKELRLPSRIGARVCARMARVPIADATAVLAVPAKRLRRELPRVRALDVVMVFLSLALRVTWNVTWQRRAAGSLCRPDRACHPRQIVAPRLTFNRLGL